MSHYDVRNALGHERDDEPDYPTPAEIDELRRKVGVMEEDLQQAVADRAKLLGLVRRQLDAMNGGAMSDMNYAGLAWMQDAKVIVAEVEG